MKNKHWNKLGVSIAAALAPAAALGVTAGIIVSSLPKSEEGGEVDTDWDGFMKVYSDWYDKLATDLSKGITYETADVTNGKVSGYVTRRDVTQNIVSLKYVEASVELNAIYDQGFERGITIPTVEKFKSEFEQMQSIFTDKKFKISDKYILFDWTTVIDGKTYFCKFKANCYGYIEHESNNLSGTYDEITSTTYSIPPHQI